MISESYGQRPWTHQPPAGHVHIPIRHDHQDALEAGRGPVACRTGSKAVLDTDPPKRATETETSIATAASQAPEATADLPLDNQMDCEECMPPMTCWLPKSLRLQGPKCEASSSKPCCPSSTLLYPSACASGSLAAVHADALVSSLARGPGLVSLEAAAPEAVAKRRPTKGRTLLQQTFGTAVATAGLAATAEEAPPCSDAVPDFHSERYCSW